MVSMALATVLLPFLPMLPVQILLNNFLSDLPAIAIAGDSVDPERLAKALRWDIGRIRTFMVVFGLISTAFDLATFALLRIALGKLFADQALPTAGMSGNVLLISIRGYYASYLAFALASLLLRFLIFWLPLIPGSLQLRRFGAKR